MDGLTPVRGPDPGELFRNAVRPPGERTKKPGKPSKRSDEDEASLDEAEETVEEESVDEEQRETGHGIDLQA